MSLLTWAGVTRCPRASSAALLTSPVSNKRRHSRAQARASIIRGRLAHKINDSRWTPFAGAGIGWAATELNYYLQFIRKPEAEYLQIEFDPDWPNVAKRAAAGTASILDTYAGTTLFGYQALVGVDYALSERTALGAALRWTRFDDIDHEAVYSTTSFAATRAYSPTA